MMKEIGNVESGDEERRENKNQQRKRERKFKFDNLKEVTL